MKALSSDKILVAAALLLAAGSAAYFGWRALGEVGAADMPLPPVELAAVDYEPVAPEAPAVKTETWGAPGAQSRGREWIYDTFTPPEIFYNARTRQFTVKPPASLLDEETAPFGLELVAVQPEPFRLQLIGFTGTEGAWRGTFQNGVSGEVFQAAAGRDVPKLGLTIRDFSVRPQTLALPDSMPTTVRVATAVVVDRKTGREVTLTHRARQFTGTVFAFVAAPGSSAIREVRTGDVFKLGDATYRIDRIQTAPPALEVTKESPALPQPEQRTLVPRENDTPEVGRESDPP